VGSAPRPREAAPWLACRPAKRQVSCGHQHVGDGSQHSRGSKERRCGRARGTAAGDRVCLPWNWQRVTIRPGPALLIGCPRNSHLRALGPEGLVVVRLEGANMESPRSPGPTRQPLRRPPQRWRPGLCRASQTSWPELPAHTRHPAARPQPPLPQAPDLVSSRPSHHRRYFMSVARAGTRQSPSCNRRATGAVVALAGCAGSAERARCTRNRAPLA
jgi:hypothetical protein